MNQTCNVLMTKNAERKLIRISKPEMERLVRSFLCCSWEIGISVPFRRRTRSVVTATMMAPDSGYRSYIRLPHRRTAAIPPPPMFPFHCSCYCPGFIATWSRTNDVLQHHLTLSRCVGTHRWCLLFLSIHLKPFLWISLKLANLTIFYNNNVILLKFVASLIPTNEKAKQCS